MQVFYVIIHGNKTIGGERKVKKYMSWIPAILWMGVIFYLSSQTGLVSGRLSGGILMRFLEGLKGFLPGVMERSFDVDWWHVVIRKNAHLMAYLILGVLVTLPMLRANKKQAFLWAFIICVVFAISDEVHQLFVPGRSGQFKDVCIDSFGAMIGVGLIRFSNRNRDDRGLKM